MVRRAKRCHIKAQDKTGKAFEVDREELIARIDSEMLRGWGAGSVDSTLVKACQEGAGR